MLSCTAGSGVRDELERIGGILESRPDSALTALQNMDHSRLNTRRERADYALLMCSALDKNYIDICNDSIISPAMDYYTKRGPGYKKLKTYYYRGLISENAGQDDDAMRWFTKGEEYSESDMPTAGRLHRHKATLYYRLFYFDDALEETAISAECFLKCGDYENYLHRILDMAEICIEKNDAENALEHLGKFHEYWDMTDINLKADYYWSYINASINERDTAAVRRTIEQCTSDITGSASMEKLRIKLSEAYMCIGDIKSAGRILDSYVPDPENKVEYSNWLVAMSEYCEKTGDYENALTYFKKSSNEWYLETVEQLTSDIKIIEERSQRDIEMIKAKNKENTMTFTFIAVMAALLVIIRYIRIALSNVRVELYEKEINLKELDKERNTLLSIINKGTLIDKEAVNVLNQRLVLLDKVLIGHLTKDPSANKNARNSIEELVSDKDKFILDTSKVFCASHAGFANYLKERQLTDWEIGYCCLFIMGMNSKDLEPYFSVRTSNNINSAIREKLGIPSNGKKLKSYLMELYNA